MPLCSSILIQRFFSTKLASSIGSKQSLLVKHIRPFGDVTSVEWEVLVEAMGAELASQPSYAHPMRRPIPRSRVRVAVTRDEHFEFGATDRQSR